MKACVALLLLLATCCVHRAVAGLSPTATSAENGVRAKLQALHTKIHEMLSDADTPHRRHRSLQTEPNLTDVCTGLTSTSAFTFNEFLLWRPSFYEACAESIFVNPEAMLLHVMPLNEIFQQYHCFYDLAKDPPNSEPISFQPELGNTVFDEDGGAFDLEAGLESIRSKVVAEGASMATFWEIEQAFNRLYDGHVDAPDVQDNFYSFALVAIPQRLVGQTGIGISTIFSFDPSSKLQLTLLYGKEATVEELSINTINGVSVHDLALEFANNPAVQGPLQSSGARVNLLIARSFIFKGLLPIVGRPSEVLPDSFQVTYVDGQEETFVTGVLASPAWNGFYSFEELQGDTYAVIDRTLAEAFVNQPGEQFDAYLRAVVAVNEAANSTTTTRRALSPSLGDKDKKNRKLSSSNHEPLRNLQGFVFDDVIVPDVGAYSILDDCAVMKLQNFSVVPIDVVYLWGNVTNAALQAGVTKLVIDLSRNPGGLVVSAYFLLLLMFPEVDLMWFEDQWDINYNNGMTEFLEALVPIIVAVEAEFPDIPASDFQDRIDALTETTLEIYDIAVDAMVEICQDADPTGMESATQCEQVLQLQNNMTNFVASPDLNTYVDVFNSLVSTFSTYSPWSVVLEGVSAEQPNVTNDLIQAGVQTVIRGGVESNITARFNLVSMELLQMAKTAFESFPIVFDEYTIVSDGLSASAAAIVPFTASQLWKNRDRTGAITPVTLLGYGGTGNPEDMVLSSIPASVQGVHLEDPIIGDTALAIFIDILPRTLSNIDEILLQATQYTDTVAIPPFFGDTLPKMPVVNFYDQNMEPGALPLQFVRIPLDAYFPRVFTGISFEDPSDLGELYELACEVSASEIVPPMTPPPDSGPPTTPPPDSGPPISEPTLAPTASSACLAVCSPVLWMGGFVVSSVFVW